MTFRSLDLASLPRSAAGAVSTARFEPARASLVGKTADLRRSPFGAGRLACTDVVAPREPEDADVIWALSRPANEEIAYLLMEGMTALRLVAATLGIPSPSILRSLGTSERGIVAAGLAAAFRALRTDVSVHLRRPAWHGGGLVRLVFAADFQSLRERIRIDVPLSWLPPADDQAWLLEAIRKQLEIPFTLELARTTLTAAEWARARPGDVVVFEEQPKWDAGTERILELVCGDFVCQVAISPEGNTRMLTEFQSGSPPRRQMNGETMSNESPEIALTMLAAAPIELVAELGRITMRADEVMALRPGAVLPIGDLTPTTVSLKVGEGTWARGELVAVDGRLGVRLAVVLSTPRTRLPSDEADTLR